MSEYDQPSNDQLRAMARAQIKAGKLPTASTRGQTRTYDSSQKYTGMCGVCGLPLPLTDYSYRILEFPNEPEVHVKRCFDAWLQALRDELDESEAK